MTYLCHCQGGKKDSIIQKEAILRITSKYVPIHLLTKYVCNIAMCLLQELTVKCQTSAERGIWLDCTRAALTPSLVQKECPPANVTLSSAPSNTPRQDALEESWAGDRKIEA